jgi:hypothetical protein
MFESDIRIVLFMIKTKNNGVFYLKNFSTLEVKAECNCTFCNRED